MKTLIIFILLTFNALAFDDFSNCAASLKTEREQAIYKTVFSVAKELKVNHCLITSIIMTESSFSKNAVSKKGARGLMQIMPKTHKDVLKKMDKTFLSIFTSNLNNDLSHDEIENIIVGTYYIKYLSEKFSKKEHVVIAYKWVHVG